MHVEVSVDAVVCQALHNLLQDFNISLIEKSLLLALKASPHCTKSNSSESPICHLLMSLGRSHFWIKPWKSLYDRVDAVEESNSSKLIDKVAGVNVD